MAITDEGFPFIKTQLRGNYCAVFFMPCFYKFEEDSGLRFIQGVHNRPHPIIGSQVMPAVLVYCDSCDLQMKHSDDGADL